MELILRKLDVFSLEDRVAVVKEGKKINKGGLLIKHKDYLLNGVNLRTGIMIYHGYNYEDAVVISESAAKKLVHSEYFIREIEIKDDQLPVSLFEDGIYKPFLNVGDEVKVGQPLIRLKSTNFTSTIFQQFLNNLKKYNPRKYILENHTLKLGAQKYYDILLKINSKQIPKTNIIEEIITKKDLQEKDTCMHCGTPKPKFCACCGKEL